MILSVSDCAYRHDGNSLVFTGKQFAPGRIEMIGGFIKQYQVGRLCQSEEPISVFMLPCESLSDVDSTG